MMNFNDFGQFTMNNEQTENAIGGTLRIRRNNLDSGTSFSGQTDFPIRICGTVSPAPEVAIVQPTLEPTLLEPTVELVAEPKTKLSITSISGNSIVRSFKNK